MTDNGGKQILFIGCGKGGEIAAFPETEDRITGLEPSAECRAEAEIKLKDRKNVTLLPDSIFDFGGHVYGEIYWLFPIPAMLFLRADELAGIVKTLKSERGVFTLYSEIWPDNGNLMTCLGCERLARQMRSLGLRVDETVLTLQELPRFVRCSGFLAKAKEDTGLRFRRLTAQ